MATDTAGRRIFDRYVAAYNAAVASRDFSPMVERFADDGVLVFVGLPIEPLIGRAAIAGAYQDQPPDDAIDVTSVEEDDGLVVARWEWRRPENPEAPGGSMRLSHDGTRITRLDIAFDAAPPREGEAVTR